MVFYVFFNGFFMVLWFYEANSYQNRKKNRKKNRKFLEFFAKKQFLGTLVAFTIFLRFFYRFW